MLLKIENIALFPAIVDVDDGALVLPRSTSLLSLSVDDDGALADANSVTAYFGQLTYADAECHSSCCRR